MDIKNSKFLTTPLDGENSNIEYNDISQEMES